MNLNPAALKPLYEAAKKAAYRLDHLGESGTYDDLASAITLAESPANAGEVKRWALENTAKDNEYRDRWDIVEAEDGDYVLFTDYAALRAQLAEARAALLQMKADIESAAKCQNPTQNKPQALNAMLYASVCAALADLAKGGQS